MDPDTHDDPRSERSRAQLTDALTTLLRTREPREISVSALCAEAGLSRPTFYQHFGSIDEVAVAGVEQRFRRLRAELADPGSPDATYRLLVSFLEDLDRERPAWQRTIGSGTAFSATRDAVERWFADRLAERTPDAGPTVVRYAAAGFLGAVRAWMLQADGPDRPSAAVLAASLVDLSSRVLTPQLLNAFYPRTMKTRLTCPCGEVVKAQDEDELVELTQQHLAAAHPGMEYGRDEILFIAT